MNNSTFAIEPYTFNAVTRFKYFPFFPVWEISFEELPAFRMSGPQVEVVALVHKLNAAWNMGYASGVLSERYQNGK